MSAADKLRALDAEIPQFEHGYFLPERTASIIAALPALIAVVEAAENYALRVPEEHQNDRTYALDDALAALDAALGGGE